MADSTAHAAPAESQETHVATPVQLTPAPEATPNSPSESAAIPAANGSATASLQNAKDSVVSCECFPKQSICTVPCFVPNTFPAAQSAVSSVQNSQVIKDIANGPVAQNVKEQASKTSADFQSLANSRTVPGQPAATGQPLTQYHSMFYRLLSWENPRATGVTFAATILLIFAARYFNILKYAFKFTYFVLGVTASIEVAGKLLFNDGLATKMRPKTYWTIPRESLERSLEDVEQLLNFFVIECQRIVWAENVNATISVFAAALVSYWLIKLLPFWGLSLIGTCVLYLTPLIYMKNRDTIDSGIEHVSNVIGSQAAQIKNITAEQTGKATESLKSYTSEYTAKAQEYIGSRKASGSPAPTPAVNSNDFPAAPKEEPASTTTPNVMNSTKIEPLAAQ